MCVCFREESAGYRNAIPNGEGYFVGTGSWWLEPYEIVFRACERRADLVSLGFTRTAPSCSLLTHAHIQTFSTQLFSIVWSQLSQVVCSSLLAEARQRRIMHFAHKSPKRSAWADLHAAEPLTHGSI